MISAADLAGAEFDWFAPDCDDAVALFATAGAGFIPDAVVFAHSDHEALSLSIQCPGWGTSAVWDAYSGIGLYVFDWKLHSGPYRRVRAPAIPLAEDFRSRVVRIARVPRFPARFRDAPAILKDWLVK